MELSGRRAQGLELTARDQDILRWIGRHGMVTVEQVAPRFFAHEGGDGKPAAYKRLHKLCERDLLRRDRCPHLHVPDLLRLTTAGAKVAGVGLRPARLVVAQVPHALALVDLTEQLLGAHPGAELTTERQVRAQRHAAMRAGARRPGEGRVADAVLRLPSGKTVAVELELTPKLSKKVEAIIGAYAAERFDYIWWYVPAGAVARYRQLVQRNRAADYMDVREWRRCP